MVISSALLDSSLLSGMSMQISCKPLLFELNVVCAELHSDPNLQGSAVHWDPVRTRLGQGPGVDKYMSTLSSSNGLKNYGP